MDISRVRVKVFDQMSEMIQHKIIKNRRFLDDEQLMQSEQMEVVEEVFNANVREEELKELSSHFSGILCNDHPTHLAIWGKTGTGKTLTCQFFLKLLSEKCFQEKIPLIYKHLDLSTPRPCFRALNDLACLLSASRKYTKGISTEEMMYRIEESLAGFNGYFVLFVDECNHVVNDTNHIFMTFLIRRLAQQIPAKLILIFASNQLSWPDNLQQRLKSFLKLNEIYFKPYNAVDLQHILHIRVDKALNHGSTESGVIEKIAAMSSQEHGDARKAVMLLAKSAYLAEKAKSKITLDLVDKAIDDLETDRYLKLLRSAPRQMQAAMTGVIKTVKQSKKEKVTTRECFDVYRSLCSQIGLRPLSQRTFGSVIAEMDIQLLIRSDVISKGRYGRSREISLDLSTETVDKIYNTMLMILNYESKT